jgi:hypothetical protein
MPQVPKPPAGSTSARQPTRSPQTLDVSEVDAFLAFLFSNIATRPANLPLQEAAAAARYLAWLSIAGVPLAVLNRGQKAIDEYHRIDRAKEDREERQKLVKAAGYIWWNLHSYGDFEPSSKEDVLGFIRQHLDTYFVNLKSVLPILESWGIPEGMKHTFRRPSFMNTNLNVAGPGNPHLSDDLSERIFAAYHALPRAGIKRRSRKIAAALSAVNAAGRADWDWNLVNERVKGYERGLLLRLRKHGIAAQTLPGELKRERHWKPDSWIWMFRFGRLVGERFGDRTVGKQVKDRHDQERDSKAKT